MAFPENGFRVFSSTDDVSVAFSSFLIGNVLSVCVQFQAELVTRKYCQWTAGLVGATVGVEVYVAQGVRIAES